MSQVAAPKRALVTLVYMVDPGMGLVQTVQMVYLVFHACQLLLMLVTLTCPDPRVICPQFPEAPVVVLLHPTI